MDEPEGRALADFNRDADSAVDGAGNRSAGAASKRSTIVMGR